MECEKRKGMKCEKDKSFFKFFFIVLGDLCFSTNFTNDLTIQTMLLLLLFLRNKALKIYTTLNLLQITSLDEFFTSFFHSS